MQNFTNNIPAEIGAILEAELGCAESLRATAAEILLLTEEGKHDLVRERVYSRTQIFDTMITLDKRLSELIAAHRDELSDPEWQHLRKLGSEVKNTLALASETGRTFEQMLRCSSDDLSKKLSELSKGRKGVEGYYPKEEKINLGSA